MPSFNLNDYVTVAERLEKFRSDHPMWGLVSSLISNDGDYVVVRAVITDETGREIASGMAEEKRGSSPVNKTSAVENAETSAWGRALANLAYEVKRGVASREEMEKTERMERTAHSVTAPPDPIKARQAKALAAIESMTKEGRSKFRQLLMAAQISTKADEWKDGETLDRVVEIFKEAKAGTATPEPTEATA